MRLLRRVALAAALAGAAAAAWRRAELTPVRVTGDSMRPTLAPGDLLAVGPVRSPLRRGDLVVALRPDGVEAVKRVTGIPGDFGPGGALLAEGEFHLEGDNPAASTDSRTEGPVAAALITGRVRARYWPPQRARVFRTR